MQKKLIRLTEADIKNMVLESIRNIIKEDVNPGDNIIATAERLERYASQLRLFAQELKQLEQDVYKAAQQLGLAVAYVDSADMRWMPNYPLEPVEITYLLKDPNDNGQEDESERMEQLAYQLEGMLGKYRSFETKVFGDINNIEVRVRFNAWE
jgi:hypothetical protein